jgi:hypothetical protein
VQEVGDSRQHTEEQLKKLKLEENDLLDSIDNNDGSMKQKIIRLAEVMEQRLDLGDQQCTFLVHQISREITRTLRSLRCPIAPWVSEYLPEKYKDPELSRWGKLAKNINEVSIGSVLPSQQLEQSSTNEIEAALETIVKFKKEGGGNIFDNQIDLLRRELLDRGVMLAAGEKMRNPISERDYRYDIPDYFGLEELNQEVISQGNRWIQALNVFFNKKYPDRPGHIRQEVYKWANAIRVIANIHEVINEDKWSGDMSFWFDREYHAKIQSKHDAGNSTMWNTTLCASCSKNVDEDPKDCVKMKYWRPSPTKHICPQCGGTEIKLRENTREQVGDKEGDVFRDASDVLNHIPFYADIFIQYAENEKSPPIYSRKDAISGPFSKSAIGGVDKLVVPRNKNSKQ